MMHNGYFAETNPIQHCWNIIGNSAHVGAHYETVLAKKKILLTNCLSKATWHYFL